MKQQKRERCGEINREQTHGSKVCLDRRFFIITSFNTHKSDVTLVKNDQTWSQNSDMSDTYNFQRHISTGYIIHPLTANVSERPCLKLITGALRHVGGDGTKGKKSIPARNAPLPTFWMQVRCEHHPRAQHDAYLMLMKPATHWSDALSIP